MKYTDNLFREFPLLSDIHDRLEESFKEYSKELIEYKNSRAGITTTEFPGETPVKKRREYSPPKPDQFRITRYLLNSGEWEETIHTNKEGGKEFKAQLKRVMDGYDPDAVCISIYPKRRSGSEPKEYTIYFNKDAKENESKKSRSDFNVEELRKQVLGDIKEEIGDGTSNKLVQMGFNHRLEIININSKFEKQIDVLRRQNENLQNELNEALEDIDELEGDLDEKDGQLLGINSEWEKKERSKEENPLTTIFASALTKAGEGLFIRNPELLDGLGLDEAGKNKLIAKLKKNFDDNGEESSASNAGASFDDGETETWTKDKDPKHVEAIKNIYAFCKQLTLDKFKKLYTAFSAMCTDKGDLNTEVTDKVNEYILTLNGEKKEGEIVT